MPIINITLVEGRDDEMIENAIKEIARTASKSLNAPMESIRVIVQEVPANHFATGDTLKSEQ